jgi:hypothetical protein
MPDTSRLRATGALRRGARSAALATALSIGVATLIASAIVLRDPTSHFLQRRSHLVEAVEGPIEVLDAHHVQTVRLTAASGLEVELLVKRPAEHGATGDVTARPLVLLLGGHRTGRDAVHLIPTTHGAVVAALNYPYRGEHRLKGLEVVEEVPAIRTAVFDTPPAVMLALDYLLALPDVDARRVEGVGISLGAPFMVIAGALDDRLTRVWAIHGSGGSYGALETNLRRNIPSRPARVAVAGIATLLISGPRLAPERWAGQISPRSFVMLNAEDDERMPRPLVDRLYASAQEPKAMIWMPGGHVRPSAERVQPLVDTVLARVLTGP